MNYELIGQVIANSCANAVVRVIQKSAIPQINLETCNLNYEL